MCEYPPRADTAKKSDAFALQETDNYLHFGLATASLEIVADLRQRWGAAPRGRSTRAAPPCSSRGRWEVWVCWGMWELCLGGVGRVGGMTVLCFYLSPG